MGSDYSEGMTEYFIKTWKGLGGSLVSLKYRSGDVDFRAQLTTIKQANPDVLVIPTMGKCLPLAVKQARDLGLNVEIIGGDGYGDFMWEIAGDTMKNTYWVSHVDKADPALQGFFKKYEQKTGTECMEFMNAVMAYDSVYWLKNAIERAKSDDPQKIQKALEQTKGLKLMHATLTMDEFHNPKDKDGIILVADTKNKKAVFFKKVKP